MTSRLERLISLDAYIRSGARPGVEQLSRMYEVKPRTVYQDIKELRERFGLDIRYDRDQNGYYNADPQKRLPAMALSREELLLLLSGIEMLCQIGGLPFRAGLINAMESIAGERDPELTADIQKIFSYEDRTDEISRIRFVTLLQCCLRKIPVKLTFTENGQEVVKTCQPTRILFTDGRFELEGCEDPSGTFKVFLKDLIACEPLQPTGLAIDENSNEDAFEESEKDQFAELD